MAIGKAMAEARKRQGLTQQDVGQGVMYSRESIAKYETGTRTLPREMYSSISQIVDDPEFYFETWHETTGHVSIPFFNGDYIDHHPAAMAYLVKKETMEAVENLEEVCWAKPINSYSDHERETLKKALFEALDASASMINMVAIICNAHDLSMKDIFRTWQVSLKARQFKK